MRIYFDLCSLQRPLDDKTQLRIFLEAQAVLGVLAACDKGVVEMIASEVLVFENDANPDGVRRQFGEQVLAKATTFVRTNRPITANAQTFIDAGIKPMDALHLSSAVAAQADFLCTCDDRFLKKASLLTLNRTKVVTPLELVLELGKK